MADLLTAALERANLLNASAPWGTDYTAHLLMRLVERIEEMEAERDRSAQ